MRGEGPPAAANTREPDYQAYDNEFTGTIRKIVVGVRPMGEAFDPPLEWHGCA